MDAQSSSPSLGTRVVVLAQLDVIFSVIVAYGAELIEDDGLGFACRPPVTEPNILKIDLALIFAYITVSFW